MKSFESSSERIFFLCCSRVSNISSVKSCLRQFHPAHRSFQTPDCLEAEPL